MSISSLSCNLTVCDCVVFKTSYAHIFYYHQIVFNLLFLIFERVSAGASRSIECRRGGCRRRGERAIFHRSNYNLTVRRRLAGIPRNVSGAVDVDLRVCVRAGGAWATFFASIVYLIVVVFVFVFVTAVVATTPGAVYVPRASASRRERRRLCV